MDIISELLAKTSWKVFASLISIVIFYLVRLLIFRIIDNKIEHFRKRYFFRQTLNYIFIAIVALTLIIIWVEWFRSILTLLSLVIGALVIASKEALLNVLANGVIIWRGLFQVGDRIEIDGIVGDVLEAGIMYFSISEVGDKDKNDLPTGRLVKIPNSFVLYKPIWNYSKALGIVWNEITVDFKKEIEIQSVKVRLMELLNDFNYSFTEDNLRELKENGTDLIFLHKEPGVYFTADSEKISVKLRYAVKFHKRKDSENEIQEYIIKNLSAELK
ncbi:MAG: mechanosensitive ion channel domain-containing protein [Candidatus Kapaibacterium sp.]|jgi:small-conductance mechanosensitive channel